MTVRGWWVRLLGLVRGGRIDREIDEEMRFHIDMQAAQNVRLGMSDSQARRHALVSFGGRDRYREEGSDELRPRRLESLGHDLRYALRMLRKAPLFTAVAAGSLALGIGANTAVFSVVNAVLLKPLPYAHPDRLLTVGVKDDGDERASSNSVADLVALQGAKSFAAIGAYYNDGSGFAYSTTGQAEQITGTAITPGLLDALGTAPVFGRFPAEAEGKTGGSRVALLSHAFWRDRFASSQTVLGRSITLDGQAYTIIGVMPPGFRIPGITGRDDVWAVMQNAPPTYRAPFYLRAVARLAPGVTTAAANAELTSLATAVKAQYPASPPQWSYVASDLKSELVRDTRATVLVLYASVALVLLLACANVANLFLARATTRAPELAVRTALGADRGRLMQQLVVESLVIALLAGAIGVTLAWWGVRAFAGIVPSNLVKLQDVSVDRTVLLVTFGICVLIGLVLGLVPALQVRHGALANRLREDARAAGEGAERRRLRSTLVVSEVALALMVLIGAGLTVNSLVRLQRVQSGIGESRLLVARFTVPQGRYPRESQMGAFYDQLLARLGASPGVTSASVSMAVPPDRLMMHNPFTPEGKVYATGEAAPLAEQLMVSPDYFKTLGIPVRRGRAFTAADRADATQVVIINETMARRFFPGQDPIGRWIQTGDPSPSSPKNIIVGIVPDVKYAGLDAEPNVTIYTPLAQSLWWRTNYLVLRGPGDPTALVPTLRSVMGSIDPQMTIQETKTMDELIFSSVAGPRFRAGLLATFGLVALTLAGAGIYGVMSYTVNQRRRETGVRLALGARRADILRMVIGDGLRLMVIGLVAGLLLAVLFTRWLRSVLFGVSPNDPLTFALTSVFLGLVGVLASAIPAYRASKTDPMVTLRGE
jgi:putative ABC transport system permease protein